MNCRGHVVISACTPVGHEKFLKRKDIMENFRNGISQLWMYSVEVLFWRYESYYIKLSETFSYASFDEVVRDIFLRVF